MFNIEESRTRKKRFLESEYFIYDDSVKEIVQRIFNKAEEVEIQQGADLAEFTIDKVSKLFKYFNSRSKGYLTLVAFYCSSYYTFCVQEGFIDNRDVKNYYATEFSKSIIDDVLPLKLLEEKFFTKERILDYIDSFDDFTLKFLLYAPFHGIWGNEYEELINIKITDLNKDEKQVVLFNGRKVKVDDLFINLIESANAETWYHPKGKLEKFYNFRRNYFDSPFVIKAAGVKSETASVRMITSRYRDIQNLVGNKMITCGNLYLSGLINYIKERHGDNGITLKQAFTEKSNNSNYVHEEKTQQYINDFGANVAVRMLRYKIKDFIELF
jgi:hypothetical protein